MRPIGPSQTRLSLPVHSPHTSRQARRCISGCYWSHPTVLGAETRASWADQEHLGQWTWLVLGWYQRPFRLRPARFHRLLSAEDVRLRWRLPRGRLVASPMDSPAILVVALSSVLPTNAMDMCTPLVMLGPSCRQASFPECQDVVHSLRIGQVHRPQCSLARLGNQPRPLWFRVLQSSVSRLHRGRLLANSLDVVLSRLLSIESKTSL